jgi:ribosomal protein S18 acetylase RimI-like enzyme
LAANGYEYFVLDVLTQNTRAVEFYIKHGYNKAAQTKVRLGEHEYPLTIFRKRNNQL